MTEILNIIGGAPSTGEPFAMCAALTTSNPIESMISIARTTNRNVTHWRDGQMVLRWTAAGLLNARRSFRRVRGYKQMPQLVAALHRHAHPGFSSTRCRPEQSVAPGAVRAIRLGRDGSR
jgi:hypothetical protein